MSDDNLVDDFIRALAEKCWGEFPFGRPNKVRPPTGPSDAALAVLGVYPSALHLSWRAPDARETIGALAVDVEPSVFWSGEDAAGRARRISEWKAAARDDGTRGTFGWAVFNGSSGSGLAKDYLAPLGITYEQCFLTDCVPFYFVKSGDGEQGAAIDMKWKPCAAQYGWTGGDLPGRPSVKGLVELATNPARALTQELENARPRTVVTLGQEAADALEAVVRVVAQPRGLPLRSDDAGYGIPGRIALGEREVKWIPLAHPGATGRKGPWCDHHKKWKSTAATLLDDHASH